MEKGKVIQVKIYPEAGGMLYLVNPFRGIPLHITGATLSDEELQRPVIGIKTEKGKMITLQSH